MYRNNTLLVVLLPVFLIGCTKKPEQVVIDGKLEIEASGSLYNIEGMGVYIADGMMVGSAVPTQFYDRLTDGRPTFNIIDETGRYRIIDLEESRPHIMKVLRPKGNEGVLVEYDPDNRLDRVRIGPKYTIKFTVVPLKTVNSYRFTCFKKVYKSGSVALRILKMEIIENNKLDVFEGRIGKELLEKDADVNAEHSFWSMALWQAAEKGLFDIVNLLLESKADVNIKRKTGGTTALWQAAWLGHTDVVKLLLTAGADVNAKASDGHTPLSIAKKRGHTQIIKLLKEYGAED